jgi:hypothetical protein
MKGGTALNPKKTISLALACIMCMLAVIPAAASSNTLPYYSYIFDYWEDMVFTPAPYVPGRSVTGISVGVGAFSGPQDFTAGPDGLVYIADTGNNRIVILNHDMTEAVDVIEYFYDGQTQDTFNRPFGVAVSPDNVLYIADRENHRVVALSQRNGGWHLERTISDPQSELLEDNFVFMPLKLAVDFAGRVYVIAFGMFEGIMVFSPEGDFIGFFGTINVHITPWEIMWRAISTRAQRERQLMFIPTEFTGIDVDDRGFIYASNIDGLGEQAVRRLNPNGEDVIRTGENEHLGGDIGMEALRGYNPYTGPSVIVDVTYRGKGMYSLLDSRRGRIFTYDHEGNLLYIFGGLGTQAGTFRQPVAIEAFGERLAVLDAIRNEVMTFDVTLYGQLINQAVGLRFDGDESQAVEKWRQVLKLNENLEIANIGIGKAYLTSGDNERAMHYLRLGQSRTYYSIAYKRYRNEILKENMAWILTSVVTLAVGLPVANHIRKRRKALKSGGAVDA